MNSGHYSIFVIDSQKLILTIIFHPASVGFRARNLSFSMAANVKGDNNLVGKDCKVGALEEASEGFREEQQEQMQQMQATMLQIQATLVGLTLSGNYRRPEVTAVNARGVAHGALIAKQNYHRPARHHPNCNDESEDNDVLKLNKNLPIRRQEDCEDYHIKTNIPPFHGNLYVEEFLDWLTEINCFFDLTKTLSSTNMKIVAYKLKDGGTVWWDQLQRSRTK